LQGGMHPNPAETEHFQALTGEGDYHEGSPRLWQLMPRPVRTATHSNAPPKLEPNAAHRQQWTKASRRPPHLPAAGASAIAQAHKAWARLT